MDLTAPLLLQPIIVPKPWGGHRLAALGRHDDHETLVGESWDVADLPTNATPVQDPVCRILDGAQAGPSLHDVLTAAAQDLLGTAARSPEGRFPLLVKLLDARETLSVQVHPPATLEPDRYKVESWVVLDAEPGAELLLGFRDGATRQDVTDTIGTKAFLDLCAPVPATPGDVIHLPAGTVHALGAGVLVAEVQTPSDVTHRLWDWPDLRDGGRELHVEAGQRAIEAGWDHNFTVSVAPGTDGRLVETEAYTLERLTLGPGAILPLRGDAVEVLVILDGTLSWARQDREIDLGRTGTVVVPAATTTTITAGAAGAQVLRARP